VNFNALARTNSPRRSDRLDAELQLALVLSRTEYEMSAGQQALDSLGVITGETPEQRLARENREAIERQAHSHAAAAAAHNAEEAKLPDARIAMSLGSVEGFAGGMSQNAPVGEASSVPQPPPPPPPGSAPLPTQPSAALAEIIQHGPSSISAESLTPSMAEQSQCDRRVRASVRRELRVMSVCLLVS
jgi:hypothetical protein